MDLGISGRKAIVCASNRGLGRACAEALAENGVEVVVNGIDAARLAETARQIAEKTGAKVTPVAGDVSDPKVQEALLAACPEPDILVNNNGGPPLRDFRQVDRKALLEGVTQNFATPLEMIQHVIDGMCERKFGRIVNITSASVVMPIFGLDLSSGARAGLTSFLAGVCRSVAAHNVTINSIQPGFFDTDRLRGGLVKQSEMTGTPIAEIEAARAATVPAKRFGQPEEFGQTCAFLCSVHAGYITGKGILMDGGLHNAAF